MLATTAEPFDSKDFLFEVKWDGFRCLGYLGESTLLQSRNRLDFSPKFPELTGLHRLAKLPVIVDGEIVSLDGGIPSFSELQRRHLAANHSAIARAAARKPVTYAVFDLLYAGGEKLLNLPLTERRDILRQVLEPADRLFISEEIYGSGLEFYRACVDLGLEGVVAKKLDSPYVPGKRPGYWKKFKKALAGDFVICGFKQTRPPLKRVDALLLGGWQNRQLIFQGTVGAGLGGLAGQQLYRILSPVRSSLPLFQVSRSTARGLNWVNPVFCCTVEFLEPAGDGGLRHPVFKGLRGDLSPGDCTGISGAAPNRTEGKSGAAPKRPEKAEG